MATSTHMPPKDVRKFQFDEFEGDESLGELSLMNMPDATYSQAEMDAAVHAAHDEGYAQGQQDTEATLEGDMQRLLTAIAVAAEAAVVDQRDLRQTIGSESVRLAALIARKALPAMAEAGALQEIEALIARCLSDRPEEARLVIRLNDAVLDKIAARLEKITSETGFAGKPILLADAALQKSEIRIEWANGGVDWSFARQLDEIESACRHLVARPKVKAFATPAPKDIHDDSPMDDIIDTDASASTTDPSGE